MDTTRYNTENEEKRFFLRLTVFLNDKVNEGKTEYDFLEITLRKLISEKNQLQIKIDTEIKSILNDEDFSKYESKQITIDDFICDIDETDAWKLYHHSVASTNLRRRIQFYQIKLDRFKIQIPTLEVDFSESNAVQKIIYLKELGIIDVLLQQPCFATSTNNLAKALTAITGEKISTLQPYLNVLINKSGNENNNPYKSQNTVDKVKNKLLELGVKLK